jgi:adhesin transport system outer membrane protein
MRVSKSAVLKVAMVPVWLALGLSAHAQSWPVSRVLQEAALNHPSVKTRQSEWRAAEYELQGAEWGRYPSLSTELQGSQGGGQGVVRVQQPLWSGGGITSQIDLGKARLSGARSAVVEAQQTIMLEAANVFFEIQRLQSRLLAAQDNEAEHLRLQSIIERRVAADVSPMTDATQARARMQQAVFERLQFQRQLDNLKSSFEQLVGQPPRDLVPPKEIRMDGWNSATLLEAALRYSPERQRLMAQVEAGQAQIASAKSAWMPLVALGYEIKGGRLNNGEDRTRLFVGLTAQTGAGLSSLSNVELAAARQQAAREELERHRRQLEQSIQTGWSEVGALSTQLSPTRALLSATDEVVDSYLRQFQVGRKTWLDVLNAQREKTNARYALADTEAPLMLAKLRLLLLAGVVQPDSMIAIHD